MSLKKLTKRSLTSEMDRHVLQMMKLLEENGDSFAQKAEMYYQKRPELIALVEEFYRGYRSLAERYEHVTGELWKNIPSDCQSQPSFVSDNGSEPSSWPSPSPRKMGRRISSNRAAGFDFFLGSGGNNYDSSCQKDGDGASTMTDTDDEFDDNSSINSYSGFFANSSDMNKRIVELEIELREAKEKIFMYEQEHGEEFGAKINAYQQELRNVNERLRISEEENNKLKIEVEKYKSMESSMHLNDDICSRMDPGQSELDPYTTDINEQSSLTDEDIKMKRENMDHKLLEDELRIAKGKVENHEMQIASLKFETSKSNESIEQLQDKVNLSHKEADTWKIKFNSETKENTKLQERISRLKTSLSEREQEIKDLKILLSDIEQKSFFEKAKLKTKVCKLLEQKSQMVEKFKGEIEILNRDIRDLNMSFDDLLLERYNLNEEVDSIKEEMNVRVKELEDEIERQKIVILEGAEEKREAIRQLCFSIEYYRNGYDVLRKTFFGHKKSPLLAP